MAHAQKPDLVFQRNGRVHLYRRGCQFSRLLAVEVCASAVVMLDRPCSETVHECWPPTPFASFPFTSPPVLRRVPSDSVSTLLLLTANYFIAANIHFKRTNIFLTPRPRIAQQYFQYIYIGRRLQNPYIYIYIYIYIYTGLFEIIVGVLTTCHTQYN